MKMTVASASAPIAAPARPAFIIAMKSSCATLARGARRRLAAFVSGRPAT
jgi:hypothetical protein